MPNKIIASDESVKVFGDGTVESRQWFEVEGTSRKEIDNPTPPKGTTNKGKYVRMGRVWTKYNAKLADATLEMLLSYHAKKMSWQQNIKIKKNIFGQEVYSLGAKNLYNNSPNLSKSFSDLIVSKRNITQAEGDEILRLYFLLPILINIII